MKTTMEERKMIQIKHKETNEILFEINSKNLKGADLSESYLSGAKLFKADLSDANLLNANLSGADLFKADLFKANLSGADLSGADLSDSNLFKADLSDANLSGADLSDANLSGANLTGADLRGANLSGANLSDANLSNPYLQIQGSKHNLIFVDYQVQIDCEIHPLEKWLNEYEEIGKRNQYTDDEIKEYYKYIKICEEVRK
jgi:uncharacterized protein YjbI with pentapeptide repeats